MIKKMTRSNESVILLLIVLLVLVCGALSPAFRSMNTVFNMVRAMIITSILAISSLLISIVGGLDLSFMSIASFSMYSVVQLFTNVAPSAPVWLMFLVGVAIGVALGLVNAFFVIVTKMPIFIVTLATQFIFSGACLAFVGTAYLQVPQSMVDLSTSNIVSMADGTGGQMGINISVLFVLALYIGMHFLLRHTKFGRSLYAMGGDTDAARRVGIDVSRNTVLVFALAGGIAAIAGVLNGSLLRLAVPGDLVGGELTVIAAVILGGANSALGKGTVHGTFLGVALITLISNSLNLLKIPSFWQAAVLGAVIILGTVFSSLSARSDKQRKNVRKEA